MAPAPQPAYLRSFTTVPDLWSLASPNAAAMVLPIRSEATRSGSASRCRAWS